MSTGGGRTTFLGDRIPFHRATVVDTAGDRLGEVDAIELVTVGQRKGLGLPGGGPKRYVLDVDVAAGVVVVGDDTDLLRPGLDVHDVTWVDGAVGETDVLVQCSAHGDPRRATIRPIPPENAGIALSERFGAFSDGSGPVGAIRVEWDEPQRRIAPGQSVVFYDLDDTRVLGGGIAG